MPDDQDITLSEPDDQDITLSDLARMMKRGFDDVDTRFDNLHAEIERRFDAVDGRFDALGSRMASLETRVERLERRVSSIEEILTEHGKELRAIRSDLKELKAAREIDRQRLAELEKRVARLEADSTGTPQAA